MKKRKWVLFAFIVLIAVGMSFFQAWRLLQANEKLKNIILSEISPALGDSTRIDRVKVGYGNIHIMGIHIYLPHRNTRVEIADLRIGYNFINYLANGFDAAQLSQDVMAINPRVTLYLPQDGKLFSPSDSLKTNTDYSRFLQRLSDINRVSIKKGEFYCVYADSNQVRLVHNIDGGLFKTRQDSLLLQIRGQFQNSTQENVWVHGHYNLNTLHFEHVSASLNYYDLQDLPFIPQDKFQIEKGAVSAQFHLYPYHQNGFYVDGKAIFSNLSGLVMQDKAQVENVQAVVNVSNDSLQVEECSGIINQASFTAKGTLSNFANPYYHAEFQTDDLALSKFSHLIGDKLKNQLYGPVQLKGTVRGSKENGYQLSSRVYSRRIKYKDFVANRVQANLLYDGSVLNIPSLKAGVFQNDLNGELTIDFSQPKPQIVGQVFALGDVRSLFPFEKFPHITAVETQLSADISGELADPIVLGNIENATVSTKEDTFYLPAAFSFHNKHIRVVSTNASHDFKINAHVNFNAKPWPLDVELINIGPLLDFWKAVPANPFLASDFSIDGHIQGIIDNYNIKSTIDWRQDSDSLQRILLLENNIYKDENGWNSRGQFVLHPEQNFQKLGGFTFLAAPDYWQLSDFHVDKNFSAELYYDRTDEHQLSGSISAEKVVLDSLFYFENLPFHGEFSTDLQISGKSDFPVVQGDMLFDRFAYKGIGPYNLYVNADYDSSGLDLQRFTLGSDKNTLLFAEGQYHQPDDVLNFSIKGAGFDLSEIMDLTADSLQVTGQTLVDVAVHGKPSNPKIVGIVAVKDGKLGDTHFDRFELLLADVANDSSDSIPGVHITQASISKQNHWSVQANGFVPFQKNDSLDVLVQGSGNFLYILAENSKFFQNPSSTGSLSVALNGTLANPVWQHAELNMQNMVLDFKNTIPTITQASAKMSFYQDENFVSIDYLQGLMGDKPFSISNELARTVYCEKEIDNVRVGGLNLGVIKLKTPEKGVPLNFQGLMEPQKYATVNLLGLNSQEDFYFAGDGEYFTIRGQIDLYDGEIMYPFYQRESPPNPRVKKFLRELEWDLLVIPKKNVRYVKTFPGAIDEAYVNLQLDEDTGALEFSGRLTDETFRINGLLRSNTGFIEYLNMTFRVESAGVEFDRGGLTPVAYGRASTTYTDSLGLSSKIYLTLQTVDNTMNKKQVDESARLEQERARFDQVRFKLFSDNPNLGTTEAQILAMLGYSTSNLQEGALQAIGQGTDNIIFRPLLRPIERKLEESLRLDYVRFSSPFTKNLLLNNLQNNYVLNSRLGLLKSTKIVVGKYFANSVFLQYTGEIESGFDYAYKGDNVGWHHTFGLEYRINPQLLVELQYDYDSLLRYDRDDKRIVLRHWFPF